MGISGQPLYADDSAYCVRQDYNPNTGLQTETLYYFWVKGKVTVPSNTDRDISAADVFNLINDPSALGQTYAAFIDTDKFLLFNYKSTVTEDYSLFNIEYYNSTEQQNQVHNEYQLLTEGVSDSLPSLSLENKWIDSLVGRDMQGNRIPASDLPEKQKYGIAFRPRLILLILKHLIV